MAGIGFELNKILARENYTSLLQAYTYAGLVGSGPWLVAVLSMGLLGAALRPLEMVGGFEIFFVAVSVIYALTLVLTGPIQLVLTRYAADLFFQKRPQQVFPAFLQTLAWVSLGSAVLGLALFLTAVPGPLAFRLSAAMVMVLVSGIWIASVFLTAVKKYLVVLGAFGAGCLTSFLAAWALAPGFGISGAMFGFGRERRTII